MIMIQYTVTALLSFYCLKLGNFIYIYICIYISHLPYNLIVHVNKLLTNRIMIFCTDIFSVQRRALIVEGCLLGTIRSFRFLSEVQYFNEKQDAFTQEVSQQGS